MCTQCTPMPPGVPDTADLGNGHGTHGGEVVKVELMVSHAQSTGMAMALQCDEHDGGSPPRPHDQEGDGRRCPPDTCAPARCTDAVSRAIASSVRQQCAQGALTTRRASAGP